MKFIRTFVWTCVACLIVPFYQANAFAYKTENYAVKVSFSDTEQAKWMVYEAFLLLHKIHKKNEALIQFAIKALDKSRSPSEIYDLNLKFQATKQLLEETLNAKNFIYLRIFDQLVTIEINDDGNGNSLFFDLPKTTLESLGIADDDLSSLDSVNDAIIHLQNAINTIDELFPLDNSETQLKRFALKTGSKETQEMNTFYMSSFEDSKKLLSALVVAHANIKDQLIGLMALADKAAATPSPKELDMLDQEFQELKYELATTFIFGFPLHQLKLFNDSMLTFQTQGATRNYQFTKLDLTVLNIENDSILDFNSTFDTIEHLAYVYTWIRDWLISGDTPFAPSEFKFTKKDLARLKFANNREVLNRDFNLKH